MSDAYVEKKASYYIKSNGAAVKFWRVRYGVNRRKSKSFKSKTAAIDWRDLHNSKVAKSPTAVSHLRWTFEQLCDEYKKDRVIVRDANGEITERKLRTAEVEERKINYIVNKVGYVRLMDFSKEVVRGLEDALKNETLVVDTEGNVIAVTDGEKRSQRTINAYMVTLRTILNYAAAENYMVEIPNVNGFIDKSKEIVRDNIITPNEFKRLLAACDVRVKGKDRKHLKLILLGLYYTASRRSELAGILKKDIDLTTGIMVIKNGKRKDESSRRMFIAAELRAALIESGIESKADDEVVFGVRDYKRSFATAKRIAKIDPDFRIHDIRRVAASQMLESGATLSNVKAMIGHTEKSQMLSKHYLQLQSDFITEQGKAFDEYIERRMASIETT